RGPLLWLGGGRRGGRAPRFDRLGPLHAFLTRTASLSKGQGAQPGQADEIAAIPAEPVPAGAQELQRRVDLDQLPVRPVDQRGLHLVVERAAGRGDLIAVLARVVLSLAQPSTDQTGQGDLARSQEAP